MLLRGLIVVALLIVCGRTGAATEHPIDVGDHRGIELSVEGLEAWFDRAVPTTPDELDRLDWLIGGLAKRIETTGLDPARTATVLQQLTESRRSTTRCLARWTGECTLLTFRRHWETIRNKHFSGVPQRKPSAERDAAQRRRVPSEDDDLFERLEFVEREYSDLLDYASSVDVPGCRENTSVRNEASRRLSVIRQRLWRPLVPLSRPARTLRQARQVYEETRPLMQALLSTPWCDTFVEAALREIPLELRRIRTARERLQRDPEFAANPR